MPATPYDDVVAGAPNMFWGSTRMLADNDNVVREWLPLRCVSSGGQVIPLFNAALLSYGSQTGDKIPSGSPAKRWIAAAGPMCGMKNPPVLVHGEPIDFHISTRNANQTWPPVRVDWPGAKPCGGRPPTLMTVTASAVAQAGKNASPTCCAGASSSSAAPTTSPWTFSRRRWIPCQERSSSPMRRGGCS